ncbi:MAG: sigma-70 family RNA polymerase sigma factor [Lachnospiraceae bacterium]
MKCKIAKEEQFDRIYQDTVKLVYKTALSYTNNNIHVAQDVVQNTFLQLYIHLETMNFDNLNSWLITTAKNNALNCYKKSAREEMDGCIMEKIEQIESIQSAEAEYICEMEHCGTKCFQEEIFQKMYETNERWYEAMTLVYCLEVPQIQVAEKMNISITVLQSLLYRAKKWIRKNYGDRYKNIDQA